MVAIDERSSVQLQLGPDDANKFGLLNDGTTGKFSSTGSYSSDLRLNPNSAYGAPAGRGQTLDQGGSLENTLIGAKVSYHIFTSNVLIRGAKWSRAQSEKP
jgi:hypothetical protein